MSIHVLPTAPSPTVTHLMNLDVDMMIMILFAEESDDFVCSNQMHNLFPAAYIEAFFSLSVFPNDWFSASKGTLDRSGPEASQNSLFFSLPL